MSFVHLHLHNEFSQLDGLGKAEQYAEEASRLGFEYLALTNHGNVDGNIRFQKACESKGIKTIHGCELYVVDNLAVKQKGEKRYHITVFVHNQTGWENLLKMLTIANVEGFYRKPRVDVKTLLSHAKGLIFATACSSSFIHASWGEKLLLDLKNIDPRGVYLEIMPHKTADQEKTNTIVMSLSKKHNIPLLATNDCHYPTPVGAKTQEVLLAIQSKTKWTDKNRWRFDVDGLHLRTLEEMELAFKQQGIVPEQVYKRALRRTVFVAKECEEFSIKQLSVNLPKVPGYEDRDETELLRELVWKGFQERLLSKSGERINRRKYIERIEEELELICKLGFQRYFLIVWELVNWCKNNDIMVGPGRGSSGGSLVAYLLYITDVDPLKYGLLFSRFISPARIDLPDIDMDFEDVKRDKVREHLEQIYGKDKVAGVSTFFTMKGRAALRDTSRVFNIPNSDVDAAAKSIVVRSGGDFRSSFTIEDAFDTFEDGIRFKKKYPEVSRIAMELEGQVRGSGQHAAAICISGESLYEGKRCNLCVRNGVTVINWDKHDAEYMGLMKLDVLGLSALTVLNQTRSMVKRNYGADIRFDEIPLDDPRVYEMISKGQTVGAFQIGSAGLSSYCKELGVDSFEMLVHATSLWRPGTLRSGLVSEFAERKKGKPYKTVHPAIDELTKDTFGIILYQEQIMLLMYELAGLGWKTCDTVRKVISKSQGDELFRKFKQQFVAGCLEKGTLNETDAGKVWDELASFGSYGFNKSHAVEYSMITYWDMYFKVYYPAEFMACSLTYGDEDKKAEYVEEAKRLGLKINLPKIGVSHPTKWEVVPGKKELWAPFSEIKGIGEKTAEKIQEIALVSTDKVGFFGKKTATKRSLNKKVSALLDKMHRFNEGKLSEEENDELQELFQFSISSNPMRKVKGIYELLKGKITLLEEVDFAEPNKSCKLFFGILPQVKYGYRQAVLKAAKGGEEITGTRHHMLGTAEALGGVYGFLKDMSTLANAMVVFNSSLYSRRKSAIEHCEGKWFLLQANHPRRATNNLFCERAAFEEDLLNCDFDGIDVDLLKLCNSNKVLSGLVDCKDCVLRDEARAPVSSSSGRYNVMILGEAPGREEDRQRECFVGAAGQVLWEELLAYGCRREDFYVTNVVKCHPSKTKTPSKRHINTCSAKWLDKEIAENKPVLILALGNTSLHYFKDQEGGITQLNGTTEWDAKRKTWICWCVHPASVLYQENNRPSFREGIANFVRCLENLGYKHR